MLFTFATLRETSLIAICGSELVTTQLIWKNVRGSDGADFDFSWLSEPFGDYC